MSREVANVKVIDFSEYSLEKEGTLSENVMRDLGSEMIQSLEKDGTFMLKNAGVCANHPVVKDVWQSFDDFRPIPFEQRKPYMTIPKDSLFPIPMYSPPHTDTSFRRKDDFVESLNFWASLPELVYPEEQVPGIRTQMKTMMTTGVQLLLRVLDCMAVADNQDPETIRGYFRGLLANENKTNNTQLRLNYYAPANKGDDLQNALPGIARHKDLSVLTLDIPSRRGLQIETRSGQWVDVPFIPDASLIIAGSLFPFIFHGNFHIPEHQVVVTHTEEDFVDRKSTICFLELDNDCVIETKDSTGTVRKSGIELIKERFKNYHY